MSGQSNDFAVGQGQGLPFAQNIDGCLEAAIGEYGLTEQLFRLYSERARQEVLKLKDDYHNDRLPLLKVPEQQDDITEAEAALQRLSEGADLIIFFGTGGSSLGGQVLAQMSGWNIPGANYGAGSDATRPRTRFYDNLDPATLEQVLGGLDLMKTRFVVTSKSGGTTETLAQAITALSAVKSAGLKDYIPALFLGITEPAVAGRVNGLRTLFGDFGIPMLNHHTGVGGRYSCLTNVGLLPALVRGLDASAIRRGAHEVVSALLDCDDADELPAATGAAIAVALSKERAIRNVVLMPYADRLGRLAPWFVQLWAESLGKNGEGTAPIGALGPVDQHSQLQLFMDGPREHFITVLRTATAGMGPVLDRDMSARAGVGFLAGRAVGDIVDAQAHAVPEALAQAGRPVRTIDVCVPDERSTGALLMHFMLETIIAGRMLGIDPFDQPAVELAKTLTRQRLN